MSPELIRSSSERVDKRVDALEARIEALTERILSLEKEPARLEVLLDIQYGARSRLASR